ncbi:DUF3891 family protein [Roseomonas xinghualingensis]|uniref:DUF3891 family protein n=1 Tax=Roseomonas xinghualingensis TaxID=2986475 RepID=UPI0021F139C4|nr:DUF3891 family protein [Roseomonas sp. SXEYE001]MCV4207318.1 DUF3891 family protein [Roseomonas sp. SXEYE001]
MIIREAQDGIRLFIPQPAHALLSGQIMEAWGALGFARPDPEQEVILAAYQHDISWMPWEAAPTLDPATGLPHPFTALGAARHAPMWARGVELAQASWGLWPALLISRHGSLIYTRYANPDRDSEADKAAAAHYLSAQGRLQSAWAKQLGASVERVDRNAALVAVADALSLALCFAHPGPAGEAPLETGDMVKLALARPGKGAWSLTPWPFRQNRVTLRCEALQLPADTRWTDEAAMRRDLRDAPRVILAETLCPE